MLRLAHLAGSATTKRIRGWTGFVLILFAASACKAWVPTLSRRARRRRADWKGTFA